MILFFWISLVIIFYTYIGYSIVLFFLVRIRRTFYTTPNLKGGKPEMPTCSVLIAAYNEEGFIRQKILNTLLLDYPPELLNIYIVADGSNDRTAEIVREFPQINLLYSEVRRGKVHAINRAMQLIKTEIVVFTDANTFLNDDALLKICRHYEDPLTGGVAGEKRIFIGSEADAATAGESMYWRYESLLKRWDSELNTTVGAAGELFSIRRSLYHPVAPDTILDDFLISMQIAMKGFKITYEPDAYATETSSSSINEEFKRKVRIAAGGIQSIIKFRSLLNPIKHPTLSFQYISHRLLRWSITPLLLPLVLIINGILLAESSHVIYKSLFISQVLFYLLAVLGLFLEKKELRLKISFVPYYFCMMNYSVIAGMLKYWKNDQSSIWEKVERKENIEKSVITLNHE